MLVEVTPAHQVWNDNHPVWETSISWRWLVHQNRCHYERYNRHSSSSLVKTSSYKIGPYPFMWRTKDNSNGASSLPDGGTTWSSKVNRKMIERWTVVMKLIRSPELIGIMYVAKKSTWNQQMYINRTRSSNGKYVHWQNYDFVTMGRFSDKSQLSRYEDCLIDFRSFVVHHHSPIGFSICRPKLESGLHDVYHRRNNLTTVR